MSETEAAILREAYEALLTCQNHRYSDGMLHHQTFNDDVVGNAILSIRASGLIADRSIRNTLLKFLDLFPLDAERWDKASDEIRDIAAYFGRKPSSNAEVDTPAKWNSFYRRAIVEAFDGLSEEDKRKFYAHFGDWFIDIRA